MASPFPEQAQISQVDLLTKKAVASARRHDIDVRPGTKNSADGNCAIESVLLNINERPCFSESFSFSADYYRRIWITDFKNRTVDNPTWNIYTRKEWEVGWNEMMESGVYERGLFGDLMLFAIACGVRKFLLIFNTNLNTPHDPIYVCDPQKFGVQPSTCVPLVLAYDMAHYESLCPITSLDVQRSTELVEAYLKGNYKFSRQDLPFLLSLDEAKKDEQENNDEKAEEANKLGLSCAKLRTSWG